MPKSKSAKRQPVGKLVPNEPVGERESFCHLNKGDKPHEWKFVNLPVYSEQDVAAGEALRQARKTTDLTFGTGGELLGLRPSELSDLERGRQRFKDPEDVKKMLELYKQHRNPNRKPEPKKTFSFEKLVAKALKEK